MAKDSSFYVSGAPRPKRVPRSEAGFRPPAAGNIAAIDFGTTSCSVAYCQQGSSTVQLLKLDGAGERVPTRILIGAGGQLDFGQQARMKYANCAQEDRATLHYFDQIKMNLHHDSNVHWNYTVKDLNGKEFFLVEVIAMILKYLKEKVLGFEGRGMAGQLNATDFDWVITVPAIWSAKGKQMMREAAHKAGLTTNDETAVLKTLTDVERRVGKLVTIPETISDPPNPHRLSLALEPEVAAIHCKKVAKERGVPCSDSKCYMVIDIGGGTVDITAHRVSEGGLVDVILPPTGNDWGGTRVNKEFKKFLGTLVDDEDFERFLQPQDTEECTESQNIATLDTLINDTFETQKQYFGDNGSTNTNAVIQLPYDFVTTYSKELKGAQERSGGKVWYKNGYLNIQCCKMEEFFSSAIDEIKRCLTVCMQDGQIVANKITAVFLVGGFGGCKYVHGIIEEEVHKFSSQCEIFRSDDHLLAVVRGAVAFRQNPTAIHSRIANITYGAGGSIHFDPKIHDTNYRFYDDDRKAWCDHVFIPIIVNGDTLHAGELLDITFRPLKHRQKEMTVDIYASKKKDIMYVTDPEGKPLNNIKKVAKLTVRMPITDGDKHRRVKVTADFTQTEIQIQAYDVTSGEKVTTVVDFLVETELHTIDPPNEEPIITIFDDASDP